MSLVEPHAGLSSIEVEAIRRVAGWNELPRPDTVGPLRVFLRQFSGLLVLILIAAALVALAAGELVDALAIGLVVLLNAVLGFIQEWKAETALEALRSMLSPTALVIRDGAEKIVPAREIVPGDRVLTTAGEGIAADIRLELALDATTDESAMTGESMPVEKLVTEENDEGMIFAGTALVSGRTEGIVVETGSNTRFGGIAALTGAVGGQKTNLEVRLNQLAKQLGLASILIAFAVFLVGMVVGRPMFEMFMTGLSLAVAIVPEGLPAVVTITLALGASAMARRNALARRLQAVETLGAASVIATDKTGTLTENQMTATAVRTLTATYSATGTGYDPAGHIEREGTRVRAEDDIVLGQLLEAVLVCSHARLSNDANGWSLIGAPTEGALVTLAYKGWSPLPNANDRLAEVPFSSERKRMSVLARRGQAFRLHVKGAPETVIDLCDKVLADGESISLSDSGRTDLLAAYQEMASSGQRVIAVACRDQDTAEDLTEGDLKFVGLIGLIDPPRPEVRGAIALAVEAGIRVIMVTGDGAMTAAAIAKQVGLGSPPVLSGDDVDALEDDELAQRLKSNVLFARTRPEHKLRIVKALQAHGQIVAMTGDGVNDAPALKQADIGVSMGQRGTDVSKNASDLVLLDDNFATIVGAIAEGRRQFDNVKKFVRYLLCSNAGEVIAILLNLALGGPLIFLATQILWMNLITDGLTAVALGLEKAEGDQMSEPPRPKNARILGLRGIELIVLFGLYTGAASLFVFYTLLPLGTDLARTAAFTGMVVFEKVSVFAFRSLTRPTWSIGWFSNPLLLAAFTASLCLQVAAVYWTPLQALLKTVPLGADQWAMIIALALPLVIVPEIVKTALLIKMRRATS
ncbi:MAG: cation-transporting P-type ATPase [Boseongicola sp.]|nr:cation-transporting P-type ATPase [Boseongicola sp.]